MWNSAGVVAVQLPEASVVKTRRRVTESHPGAVEAEPPASVSHAIDAISRHLAEERSDLSWIRLDMDGLTGFRRRVYEEARSIPAGVTISYGELAERLGQPGSARAVGQALGHNPFAVVVPCHRVLAAGGRIGGFSAGGGTDTKQRILGIEGAAPVMATGPPKTGTPVTFDTRRAVRHLRASDPDLGALVTSIGPFAMELQSAPDIFAALSEAIVHQQLSPRAAATIYRRFTTMLGRSGRGPQPERVLALADEELREVGLSRAKMRAIRDLAERSLAGEVPTLDEAQAMPDEQVIERLTAVHGVGRWTAEMFLIFRLGRPDVLPLDDYGLRRGFAVAFNGGRMPDAGQVEQRGERWRPYRTVASWYLWRAAESAPR
ncbi:MAG: methylated-DNA--[protein]-cysteine S-methyltransferase [Acidimicrobiales bacterium]